MHATFSLAPSMTFATTICNKSKLLKTPSTYLFPFTKQAKDRIWASLFLDVQQLCSNKVEEHLAHLGIVTSCPPTNFPPFSLPLPAIFYAQVLSCSENKMRTFIILYQTCTRTHTCMHMPTRTYTTHLSKHYKNSWGILEHN